MASSSDIRKGLCIKYNNDIYKIIEFLHVKPGKGPAFVRTKLKSVTNGKVIDNTFSAGHKIEDVRVETKKYQYLYKDSETYHFMNTDDYNQITVQEVILDSSQFLKEGEIEKKKNNISSKILSKLTSNPSKFIVSMLIGTNLALVVYGYFMGDILMDIFKQKNILNIA